MSRFCFWQNSGPPRRPYIEGRRGPNPRMPSGGYRQAATASTGILSGADHGHNDSLRTRVEHRLDQDVIVPRDAHQCCRADARAAIMCPWTVCRVWGLCSMSIQTKSRSSAKSSVTVESANETTVPNAISFWPTSR